MEIQVETTNFSTPYEKTTIIDREKAGKASPTNPAKPGDHNLILSIILLVVSLVNPFALLCAVPALIFSCKARSSERVGNKEDMQDNDKISFGFIIFAIISWIVSLCVTGFIVYNRLCGLTGQDCNPLRPAV